MTLPTLLTDVRNKELETGLKKGYSTIEQALNRYYANEGIKLVAGKAENTYKVKGILTKYMFNAYDCSWGAAGYGNKGEQNEEMTKACVPNNWSGLSEDKVRYSIKYKNFSGTKDIDLYSFDDGQFIATDGMLIFIENPYTYNIYISIDVNGFRKPNRLGQDLFMFDLGTDGVLRAMGAPGTHYTNMNTYCSATSSDNMNGAACTYKAFTDKNFFRNFPK